MDSNLKKRGSRLYLFEGNSVDIIQQLTHELIQLGKRPKLYFNRDVQVQYGIDRDRQILDFYQQQSLEVHQGRNHFLQSTENYDTIWDASMRQLNSMGWMNFRMRAMCVTFLGINCGVSWHHGAQYFMSKLVDGNIAINHWQWQAQAGVTNPMSKTFRIYNPTKNLQDKDPNLQFVRYWIPELNNYSIKDLLGGAYISTSNYSAPILDWQQTRKTNGKIVSDLRKQVRDRLEKEGGQEYQIAIGAKETIDKYFAVKNQQYRDFKSSQLT